MRIFLLPISTRRALVYSQRVTQKPVGDLSYVERATKKAADTWAKWEAADRGWQKKFTQYGNQGLQRISYQEWGLKSFPPLTQTVQAEDMAAMADNKRFVVHYPANIMKEEDVPKVLARLAKERKQLHWSRFVWSMVGIPFTIPFGLIPVLPNIPFFYLTFRCYSHWRALKGSDHLDFILDHRIFRPVSSPQIESVYQKTVPELQDSFTFVTRNQVLDGTEPEEHMLLTASSHTLIAKSLQVPELSLEVERAVRQVEASLQKEDLARKESQQIEAPSEKDGEQKDRQ